MTEEIKISSPEIDPLFKSDVIYLIVHVQSWLGTFTYASVFSIINGKEGGGG